jgi:hypothetical protein
MLLFGIVLVMILAAGIITILARRRPGIGSTWMIAAGVSLLAWLVLAGSPTRLFPEVSFSALLPEQSRFLDFTFRLDRDAWQYSFAIIALNVAVLFTSSARIHVRNESFIWAGSLILSAFGVLACSSLSPLSLILVWTLLDIAELGFILLIRADRRIEPSSLASFTWRVLGTLIFAGVFILAGTGGQLPSFKELTPIYFPAILLAVILRLGVFPLHPQVSRFTPVNRSAGNVINLIAPAGALAFLGRLKGVYPYGSIWISLGIAFVFFYMLYAAIKWSGAAGELNGRPFWVVTLAVFALVCVLNGQSQYAPGWGMILLLGGGGLFLASPRNKWISILLMVIFFGISGIPGSPSMSVWNGILTNMPFLVIPLFMLAAAILFFGYLKFTQVQEGDFTGVDRWVKIIYPLGLAILIISQWVIFIRNLPSSFTFIYWWCGVIVVVLALLIFLWKQRILPKTVAQKLTRIALPRKINLEAWMDTIFGMGWFTKAAGLAFGLVQWVMNLIAGVLEGEGGILWAILLLALLISYFQFGIKP